MSSGLMIKGISVVLPKTKLDLDALSSQYGEYYIKKVKFATGINFVHVSDGNKTASDYCCKASENLFEELTFDRSKVDAIVFVSQTPDYILPHTSAIMQDRLGLRNDVATFDLNFGCPGFVYGLFQAHMLIKTSGFKYVLLCCGDTISRYINDNDKALKMVMGDGFSATLVSNEGIEDSIFSFFTDGSRAASLMIPAGSNRLTHKDGITNVIYEDSEGNQRTQENVYMDGLAVMDFALRDVVKLVNNLIEKKSWKKDDIDLLALHQANKMIVKYIAKKLKISEEKVLLNVSETGNTGSCSIPVAFCKEYGGRTGLNIDKVIMCAFGTGLTAIAATINLTGTKFCNIVEY